MTAHHRVSRNAHPFRFDAQATSRARPSTAWTRCDHWAVAIPPTDLAVADIARARAFYGDVLGLRNARAATDSCHLRSGRSLLFVCRSDYAGSNEATAMSWLVGERVDGIARALKEGSRSRITPMHDMRLDGDVHVGHGMRVASFKDPDGEHPQPRRADDAATWPSQAAIDA